MALKIDARALAPFVGRNLVNRAVAEVWEAHDRALAPHGVTAPQAALLLSLVLGEAATAAELARFYGHEMSSATRMLDRLERKGLVRRTRASDDRRKILLAVTAAGERKLAEVLPIAGASATRAWQGVTMAERETMQRVFLKVLKNLEAEPGRSSNTKIKTVKEY
jgi:DNA-binding MarR family transcriptional regulator